MLLLEMSLKVLIIEDSGKIRQDKVSKLQYVVLPHPKGANVVFASLDSVIYELQMFEPRTHGAWFIDQHVSSSDKLYVAAKIDPRLLLIPFIATATRYSLMEQIVTPVNGCDRLILKNISSWKMEECCDVNDKYDDEVFYRHNEQKMLSWLTAKVKRVADVLARKRWMRLQQGGNKGFAQGFNAAAQHTATTNPSISESARNSPVCSDEEYRIANQIVGDYLPDAIAEQLTQHLLQSGVLLSAAEVTVSDTGNTGDGTSEKRKASWEMDLEVCFLSSCDYDLLQ